MKIDNSFKPGSATPGETSRPTRTQPSVGADAQGKDVSVELSSQSAQLQSIAARLNSGEIIDARRVSEIKQAIAEGRFQINSEVIADRLLATVQELIQAYRP